MIKYLLVICVSISLFGAERLSAPLFNDTTLRFYPNEVKLLPPGASDAVSVANALGFGINPLDKGATVTTNDTDTVGITAAVLAAKTAKKSVILPPGYYRIGDLELDASLEGSGPSTVIELTGKININTNNISIKNLSIMSFVTNAIVTTNRLLTNIVLQDISVDFASTLTNISLLSLDSSYTEGLKIINSAFKKGGIQGTRGNNFQIMGNTVDGEMLNGTNELVHMSQYSRGIIANNIFKNSACDMVDIFSSGQRNIIMGNKFTKCGDTNFLVGVNRNEGMLTMKVELSDAAGGNDATLGWVEETIIMGNEFNDFNPTSDNNRWYGVMLKYIDSRASPTWVLTNTAKNAKITGNTFSGFWPSNPGNFTNTYIAGIHADGYGVDVSHNHFVNFSVQGSAAQASGTAGIEVGFNSPNIGIKLDSSTVSDNIYEGEGTGIIIYNAANTKFSGNIVRKDEKNNLSPRYGILVYGTVTDCSFTDNILHPTFAGSSPITTIGTASISDSSFVGNKNPGRLVSYIGRIQRSSFTANNLGPMDIGTDGTIYEGLSFTGNNFYGDASNPGITLKSIANFTIGNNTFYNCEYAVSLNGGTSTTNVYAGVISENISHAEVAGTFFEYVNVSTASKRSVQIQFNFVNGTHAASAGTVYLGGQVNIAGEMIATGGAYAGATAPIGWIGKSMFLPDTDSVLTLYNNANTGFYMLQFGGRTTNFPAIVTSNTPPSFHFRDSSSSAYVNISASNILGSNFVHRAGNIQPIAAGSNITLTTNSDGLISIAATGGNITVRDTDGNPSISTSTIEFPEGSVASSGGKAVITFSGGGSSTNEFRVNGSIISGPNLIDSTNATIVTSAVTNFAVYPTNLANAQIATGAAIDAAKIGGGGVSTTEFNYLGTVTSDVQTQLNAKQASFTTGTGVTNVANVLSAAINPGSNITFTTNDTGITIAASGGGGGGSSNLFVNGVSVANANLTNTTSITISVSGTNVTFQRAALSGDVVANVNDNTTSIQANSVALGTDTTGNYMTDVTGTSSEISVTHTPGESSTATIGLPAVINLSSKTSFALPNSAAPTVNSVGQIALDTTITDHKPLHRYYNGTAEMIIPAILSTDLTTNDNYVLVYDAAGDKFIFEPQAGAGGTLYGYVHLNVQSAKLHPTDPARIDAGDNNYRLLFDASATNRAHWAIVVPDDFNTAYVPQLIFYYSCVSGTSGNIVFGFNLMPYTSLDAADINTDAYDAQSPATTFTAPGTAGYATVGSLNSSHYNLTDVPIAANDHLKIQAVRFGADASDTTTGDMELLSVVFKYQKTTY